MKTIITNRLSTLFVGAVFVLGSVFLLANLDGVTPQESQAADTGVFKSTMSPTCAINESGPASISGNDYIGVPSGSDRTFTITITAALLLASVGGLFDGTSDTFVEYTLGNTFMEYSAGVEYETIQVGDSTLETLASTFVPAQHVEEIGGTIQAAPATEANLSAVSTAASNVNESQAGSNDERIALQKNRVNIASADDGIERTQVYQFGCSSS